MMSSIFIAIIFFICYCGSRCRYSFGVHSFVYTVLSTTDIYSHNSARIIPQQRTSFARHGVSEIRARDYNYRRQRTIYMPCVTSRYHQVISSYSRERMGRRRMLHMTNDNDSTSNSNTSNQSDDETDWLEAELTIRSIPPEPTPDITPHEVLTYISRSLQFIDHPNPSSGLERIFPFFTWQCRKIITARKGGDTTENFMKYGLLAPALQPFMGATRIQIGEGSLTAGSQIRGDIMTFPIVIHGSKAHTFQHSSGLIKGSISSTPPIKRMLIRLEKNRRPPMMNCWLVREVIDVKYTQSYSEEHGDATSH